MHLLGASSTGTFVIELAYTSGHETEGLFYVCAKSISSVYDLDVCKQKIVNFFLNYILSYQLYSIPFVRCKFI